MKPEEIRAELLRRRDAAYRAFQIKLIPTVEADTVIGVRTPALRALARQLVKEPDTALFLSELPHVFFEENQLHAFLLAEEKDFDRCLAAVETFLPYIDNWATCDQLSPAVFRKHRGELPGAVRRWIASGETYAVRFGIGMLMEHFLDGDFDPAYPALVAAVRSEEYYVNMMIAWYFATALAKQYDAVLPHFEGRRLDPWTHNKAIQKAVESRRISPERKEYLRSLRRRAEKGAP